MRVDQYNADQRMKSWLDHYARHGFRWEVKKYAAPDGEVIVKAKYVGDTSCGFVSLEMSGWRLILDGDMGFAVAHLSSIRHGDLQEPQGLHGTGDAV